MAPDFPQIAALELPSWLNELWNASSGTATLWQTTLIALCLSLLASLITHALTKRRENSRWSKQNTLQALHRATESFYAAREHYEHITSTDQADTFQGFWEQSSNLATKVRNWGPMREDLQRLLEGLVDVQLSAGRYQKPVNRIEDLCRRVIAKLEETMQSGQYQDSEGRQVNWGSRKSDFDYLRDSLNAIHDYETEFLQLREDITADLTASWTNRQRRRFEQCRDRRKESRQEKQHPDSGSGEIAKEVTAS